MTTTTRRALAIAIPLFTLQLTACSDSLLAPDSHETQPQMTLTDANAMEHVSGSTGPRPVSGSLAQGVALADPRPSPVVGLFDQKDATGRS